MAESKLSKNFTLAELTWTSTGIANEPNEAEKFNLQLLTETLLQPIRDQFGPLRVTSGFRCRTLNTAIKGSLISQHVDGEAADFVPLKTSMVDVFKWIVEDSNLQYGQCILEEAKGKKWIHISLPRKHKPNQQAILFDGFKYTLYIRGAL